MSDLISGLRQVIQDLVSPDLKALAAKVDALKTQSAMEHDAVMKTLDAFRAEMRSSVIHSGNRQRQRRNTEILAAPE